MNKLMIQALLPLMVGSMLVACSKKSDSKKPENAPVRAAEPAQQDPKKQLRPPTASQAGTGSTRRQTQTERPAETQTPDSEPSLPGSDESTQAPPQQESQRPPVREQERPSQRPARPQAPGQTQRPPEIEVPITPPATHGSEYTTASADYLHAHLKERMNSISDAGQRRRNKEAAESIRGVRVGMNGTNADSSEVSVAVAIEKSGKTEILKLGGILRSKGPVQLFVTGSEGNRNNVKGTFVCLDENPDTCFVSLITLHMGRGSNSSVVKMISRKTNANFTLTLPEQRGNNPAFNRLVSLFLNTTQRIRTGNSLRTILLETAEVINGRSSMKLSMISRENQVIVGSGPLLASKGGQTTNVLLKRDTHLLDLIDLQNGQEFKLNIHESINEMRLIGNDRKGCLTIAMGIPDGREPQNLIVKFTSLNLPVVSVTRLAELEQTPAAH